MRRLIPFAVVAVAIALTLPAPAKPAPKPKPARVVLPVWAPKNPSREFLRAAQVFRPVPEEAQAYSPLYLPAWELFGSLTDKQVKEFLTRKQRSLPLSQIAKWQRSGVADKGFIDYYKEHEQAKQIGDRLVWHYQSVAVKMSSFSPRQRAIFDGLRKAWQEANPDKPGEDLLVMLYKQGARKDLSNVEISFNVSGGHAVSLRIMTLAKMGGIGTDEWVAQI